MREIKFRAWNKEEKRWLDRRTRVSLFYYTNNSSFEVCPDESIILMQFTGLKDFVEKDIYEGDILVGWSKLDVQEVVWLSAGFWFVNRGRALQNDTEVTMHNINDSQLKIIGNIYENPELLSPLSEKEGV
jgi:uncharacterized phage protein (TIGR01671 family)